MVAADAKTAVTFSLSPGQAGDAPEGRKLLNTLKNSGWEGAHVIMDKAYEGDETRQLVLELEMLPVVPPKIASHLGNMTKKCTRSATR
jgi:transposase